MAKRQDRQSKRDPQKPKTQPARRDRCPVDLRMPDGRVDETLVASVMEGVDNLILSEVLESGDTEYTTNVFVLDKKGCPLAVKELTRAERLDLMGRWHRSDTYGNLRLSSGRVVSVRVEEHDNEDDDE